ncbi:MAG: histidinol dehydrogenase [Acidimicrobiales bacterium]
MLRRLDLRGASGDWRTTIPRPQAAGDPPVEAVRAILADVKARGDDAVRDCTERFDKVRVDDLRVPAAELKAALADLDPTLRYALEAAHSNIVDFHRHPGHDDAPFVRDGISVAARHVPVDRAGLCVPGGEAPLISSVLMTAVPARVAGVGELVLCSPPSPAAGGTVHSGILAAAALAGVDEVYRVGGAQAVGAMAYGTASVRAVDVIAGPGGMFTSVAKREVAAEGRVGVPGSFPGPSEVVVVADDTTPVEAAAIDLIVQVEHGPDSVAWLITWSEAAATAIEAAVARMAAESPRRQVIEANLAANSWTALVDGPEQAVELANAIAPEHLELMAADPEAMVAQVRHAGAVFLGPWAPASVGDYVAGPSHVLPTYGSARFSGALGVEDFRKTVHVISVDEAGLARVGPHVIALAEAEGLAAHARSVRVRWAS